MAATTYKKYYKITCNSHASRVFAIFYAYERYHTDGQSFFSRASILVTPQIHILTSWKSFLSDVIITGPRKYDIAWRHRDSPLRLHAFLKYIIIGRFYHDWFVSCRDRAK